MKRILGIILVGVVVVCAILASFLLKSSPKSVNPRTLKPQLILNQIKVVQPQEKEGDELYLTLSARVAENPTEYSRIPEKPNHWLSRQMDLVKDVSLWSEQIVDGQSVTLIIEVNEQDALPLDPDDLLGIIRVKLKNEKGVLQFKWDIPNRTGVDSPKKLSGESDPLIQEPGNIERFDLESDGAHYEIYLSLKK